VSGKVRTGVENWRRTEKKDCGETGFPGAKEIRSRSRTTGKKTVVFSWWRKTLEGGGTSHEKSTKKERVYAGRSKMLFQGEKEIGGRRSDK